MREAPGDLRALALAEGDAEAHRLGHHQDVGEDDRGVELEALERLERDLGGQLGGVADVPEAVLGAHLAVAGQVAAGLAHQPDGGAVDGAAFESGEETLALFHGENCYLRGGRNLSQIGHAGGCVTGSSFRYPPCPARIHHVGVREWIITRPQAEAAELVGALKSVGITARAISCVERHFLDWPWPPPRHEAGWVLVTSAAMAERLGLIPDYIRVAALAPKTTQALERRGLAVSLSAVGGVEALAEALEAEWVREKRPKWFIHYPTSDLGLAANEQSSAMGLLEHFATVKRYEAYRSVAPRELAAQASMVGPEAGVIFFSPSAVKHWLEVSGARPRAVLCHGGSTLDAYEASRPLGWPKGHLATGEFPQAVIELERSAQ